MNTVPREGRKLRVVYDTNVIISGLFFHGNEAVVIELGKDGSIDVYISQYILDELFGVMTRKFNRRLPDVEDNLSQFMARATIVTPSRNVSVVQTDPDDNHILECCLEANADYLITGDEGDLLPLGRFHGTEIVNAGRFLDIFRTITD